MYLAIDIGGTKTLLAAFSNDGEVINKVKIATSDVLETFLRDIAAIKQEQFKEYEFDAVAVAVPGRLDRRSGKAIALGNLPWKNVAIAEELKSIVNVAVLIENDAKLAGLSEAKLVQGKYKKVEYVTISTGIGAGLIINGIIDADTHDSEPGQEMLEHEGKIQEWEDFASGRAIVARYDKKASEISDPKAWQEIAHNIAVGLITIIANVTPEVIIIGGGVGAHFDKFGEQLKSELQQLGNEMVLIPPVLQAQRPEEAVIYGCYEYIKQSR